MSEAILPSGWLRSKLSDVIEPRGEKALPISCGDMQFIGMDHVEAHTTKIIGGVPASSMKSSAARFYDGDVLYGRLRPYLNKVAQPNFDGLASAEFIVFPDTMQLRSKFLKLRLNAADFVSFASHLNEGDRPRVSFDQIGDFEILLPPPHEQDRIVAKIEELFSELDNGIESLKTAQAQLKVYRQALLKHAFEGKLTAAWREQNRDKLESAESLLARIQHERAERYRQQLAEWEKSKSPSVPLLKRGKTMSTASIPPFEKGGLGGISKPKAPKPLPPLTAEELAELPELPEGWVGARLGWMTCGVEYGTAAKSSETGACPVLRMGNIQNGKFDWTDLVYTDDKSEIAKYLLRDGDVLFNRTNSPELVGKSAIFKSKRQALFAGYLIRVNQIPTIVDSDYLNYFLNSHIAKQHGNTVKTDGVNQSNINGEKLVNYPFPFCPLGEQRAIVGLLDERLSEVDQLEQTLITSLQQAEALRQSILKKAFSGQLVPQDAHDEPASALLARIRAECESPHPPFAKGGRSRSGGGISGKPRKNSTGDKLSPAEISLASMSKEP